MTEEEIEAMQSQVVPTLKTVSESFEGHDLDAFLPTKDKMKSLKDEGEDKDGRLGILSLLVMLKSVVICTNLRAKRALCLVKKSL